MFYQWDFAFLLRYTPLFWKGVGVTLAYTGGTILIGLIIGLFAMCYAVLRSCGEFFREPDAQLGFLWGGLTMGMLLSIPMALVGAALAWHFATRGAEPAAARRK